jgi:tripartite-type tricarboxylate transporter receptor subunit TctC
MLNIHWMLGACAALCAATAGAQAYPTKPIRIVVPYAASGTPDLIARLLADKLRAALGQSVVVDNKPGAVGVISAQAVLAAPADGYTVWMADNGQLAINPALQKNLAYDPLRDFMPLVELVTQPFFVYAQSSLGVKSLKDLVGLAKSKPGQIDYGTVGNGSPHHLCMAMFANLADLKLNHIPYKTASQLIPGMMANDVALTCTSPVTANLMVNAGKAAPLAIAAAERSPAAPNVPTVHEALGGEPLRVGASIGMLVKAGTPAPIAQRLATALQQALREPDVTQRLQELGMQVTGLPAERYAIGIQEAQQRYGRMVRISGATVD